MLEVAATWSRNISSWIGTSCPTHLQEDKANFLFFAFSLLEHRSLSIFFMVAFCYVLTTSVFFVCFSFLLCFIFVFAGCLCFGGVSASDYISFLYFLIFVFLFFFMFYFLRSMFFLPVVCLIPVLFISFSWVSVCDSPILLLCFLLSFVVFFLKFRLNVFVLCFSFFSSFSFFVFSSPQAPTCV